MSKGLVKEKMRIESQQQNLGGGFKYFFIFTPTRGNDPI